MDAVVKHKKDPYELWITEVPMPELKSGEVLVQVSRVGICGSDLHMYAGHKGYDWITYPLILGHEITGVVRQANNKSLEGKRVVVNPYVPCGKCAYCKRNEENRCDNNTFSKRKGAPQSLQYGFRRDGGMAEYMAVPEENILPIPEKVSDNVAAVAEAIAVGLTAVQKVNEVTGQKIVIFGPGPIGLGIASILVGLQAENIVMVGVPGDEKRLNKAKKMGVHHTLITSDNIVDDLLDNNYGYDVAFDCSGHYSVPESVVNVLKKGGQLVLVGISTSVFSLEMDQMVRGEIQIKGSYGITTEVLTQILEYAADDVFPFEELIAEEYKISDVKNAFDAALNRAEGKVILKINDDL